MSPSTAGARVDLEIEYKNRPPTIARFQDSNAFVRGIRGPFGSAKSTACCIEILRRASEQPIGAGGKRRSRFAVVRNTYPELKTTTIKTWHTIVPQSFGRWVDQGPPTHWLEFEDCSVEVLFLALDSPADVAKLLSMDLTGAWINEAREVIKAVLDGLTGRVGRFPPAKEGGWSGIIMDTNSPDTDHWWYVLAEKDRSSKRNAELLDSIEEAERELRKIGVLAPDQPLFEFFAQPSGLAADAENVQNLPPGYYQRMSAGKSVAWKKIYVEGEYGFVQDGRPVHPEYRDHIHCRPFELVKGWPLYIGLDFGLTPAAAILQRTPMGGWRCRYELTTEHMGAKRFGRLLADFLEAKCPGFEVARITGDPAGNHESQADESTPYQMLKPSGIIAHPASTNDFSVRREALDGPLMRMEDGEPGFLVHPDCGMIRKGLGGRYAYKRVLGQDDRYHDKPDKNAWSHPCEALHYGMMGGGEVKRVFGRKARTGPARYADADYNELG